MEGGEGEGEVGRRGEVGRERGEGEGEETQQGEKISKHEKHVLYVHKHNR